MDIGNLPATHTCHWMNTGVSHIVLALVLQVHIFTKASALCP